MKRYYLKLHFSFVLNGSIDTAHCNLYVDAYDLNKAYVKAVSRCRLIYGSSIEVIDFKISSIPFPDFFKDLKDE